MRDIFYPKINANNNYILNVFNTSETQEEFYEEL